MATPREKAKAIRPSRKDFEPSDLAERLETDRDPTPVATLRPSGIARTGGDGGDSPWSTINGNRLDQQTGVTKVSPPHCHQRAT